MVKGNSKIKVSIIVLTINSLEMVREELNDISKLITKGLDVTCVVVDNGSTDGTEKALKDYKFKNISYKYIQTGKNLGFAGGNNVGIKYALSKSSDYILVLNDDMILSSDILVKLVSFLEKNPKIGIVSPKIYFADGYEFHKDRYKSSERGKVIWYAGGIVDWDNIYTSHRGVDEVDHGQFDEAVPTDLASGSCMLFRKEVVKKIGYLDEGLFLYWEDADFSRRAKNNGFEVFYNPTTCAWHKVSASAGGSGSKSNDYFLIRNRYYFANRYAKIRTKIAVLKDTIRLAFTGRDWQRLGAFHALIGIKGAGPWKR
jgi:GT2 family glycosyltransferase